MEPAWEAQRRSMVSQLRSRGVQHPAVLQAMLKLPRHAFVPCQTRAHAYDDAPLAIGLGQTISQPYIVGFMTELLEVHSDHRVLEVGTGSGYQTGILAMLAKEVYTIDIHADLVYVARSRLASLGIRNVRFALRDGHLGFEEFAPFDRIMVTAGATHIPPPLVEQLARMGRMVIPVGPTRSDQILKLVVKDRLGIFDVKDSLPVRFVPLLHDSEEVT
jgi:protein-L-isoaspartate(D-aspartate) O-methyltransferase